MRSTGKKSNLLRSNLFFNNTNIKSNFLINLGYGIKEEYTRLPRLDFNLDAKII